MNPTTLISVEEFQGFVSYGVYAMLVPAFFMQRKSIKRTILRGLKKKFVLLQEIKQYEFYKNETYLYEESVSSEEIFFFRLHYQVDMSEIKELIHALLTRHSCQIDYSHISNNSICIFRFRRKKVNFEMRIVNSTQIPYSFRVHVKAL